MKAWLAALIGLNPLRWRRDMRRVQSLLCDALPGGVTRSGARSMMVVLMPWLATAVPWFSLMLGVLLQRRGCSVLFVIDDSAFDQQRARARFIVTSIEKVLAVAGAGARSVKLSSIVVSASQAEASQGAVAGLAQLNGVWKFKGETSRAGRAEYVAHATAELSRAHAAIGQLLGATPAGAIIVPGGVYGTSGVWRQQAEAHGVRFASFDSGGRGLLTLAADGVACQLSDIPRAFRLLTEHARTDAARAFVVDSGLAEMARRRAGTDRFGSQLASASGAHPEADGAVLLTLNSAWDSAALGLHRVFSGSVEWMLETCAILLRETTARVLVRQHPAERHPIARGSDDYAALLRQRFGSEPRIRFVAAEDPVNTYELLSRVAAVVVHTSTVGLEAAASGRPVITSSHPYYDALGFVWQAQDLADYRRLLVDAAGGRLIVTESMRQDALRCYYLTQCCNWMSSVFCPEGFADWSILTLAQLENEPAVQSILRCVAEDVPIAFLNHLGSVDRLSSESGPEIRDVTPASMP